MTQPLTGIGGTVATTAPAAATGQGPAAAKGKSEESGFERILLGQLTKTLIDTAVPSDGASSAATSTYKDLLPDALTEALMSGGGIGLATKLQEQGA